MDAARRALFEGAAVQVEQRRTIIDRSTAAPAGIVGGVEGGVFGARSMPAAFAAYFRAWADTDFSDAIDGRHPLKALVGRHDPVFNAALMADTYARRIRWPAWRCWRTPATIR